MFGRESKPHLTYIANGLKRTKSNSSEASCEDHSFQTPVKLSALPGTNNGTFTDAPSPCLVTYPDLAASAAVDPLSNTVRQDNHHEPQSADATDGKTTKISNRELKTVEKKLVNAKIQQVQPISQGHDQKREGQFQTKVKLDENCNPQTALISILQEAGYKADTRKSSEIQDFFLQYTESHVAAYDQEVVRAVRTKNVKVLRELHRNGKNLQAANRFGESLVHMACRRGYTEVVRFLIKEANVTLRVKDDFGRTPLHDACWSAEPNFELMDLLLEDEADLLLVEDSRGHFPLTYTRKNHWKQWNAFLFARRGNIRLRTFKEPIICHDKASFVVS